jgi:two-component system response regulator FlrC
MTTLPVLVIEDDHELREALELTLQQAGMTVLAADNAETGMDILSHQPVGMVVTDVHLPGKNGLVFLESIQHGFPGLPVLVITAFGTVHDAVDAMRRGAVDYLVKPFAPEVLIRKVLEFNIAGDKPTDEFVSAEASVREVYALASRVAPTDATVMISGESGTGKEILARYLHRHSSRSAGPFVAINCAAIPENMLEAMLFGYEKGAYTGASQSTQGKFEQAQGGTLLLDEITEMDLGLQAKLLRVLQEREVERLGGRSPIALDVRVITTTNRRLLDEVAAGRFREDLYFRLNVFPLVLPPLRQRKADIIPLTEFLLRKHAARDGRPAPRLSASACRALLDHDWPGNIRELDNNLVRALVLQRGSQIEKEDLGMVTASPRDDSNLMDINPEAESLDGNLRSHEQSLILEALRTERGSRKSAAERLGISPRTLRYKIAQMRSAGIPITI